MFNSVEEIHKIVIHATKDTGCFVALGMSGYNYTIRIEWIQASKLRSLQKSFSEQMIMESRHMPIRNFILRGIQREVEYNVGKIAYEEG